MSSYSGSSSDSAQRTIHYRDFTADDIPGAHALSVAVKWPHRQEDWQLALDAGQGVVATDDGRIVGTGMCWHYGATHGSLGLIIVSPEDQGRGIGRAIMTELLRRLEGRIITLHATEAGKPLYEKLGFRETGTVYQYQGTAFQPPLVSLPRGERLRPIGTNDGARLASLAGDACGVDRSLMLPLVLDIAEGIAVDRDGELLGMSLFRRFGHGFAIGPVSALEDKLQNRAKALITHWLARNEGIFIRIDIPAESGLGDWLESLGLKRVSSVLKMVRVPESAANKGNTAVASDTSAAVPKLYGLINQAFG